MVDKFEFHPWEDYEDFKPIEIAITSPPCPHCKWWNPRINFTTVGEYTGVTLCTNEDMFHDFSCFENKEESE